jgi:F-type H+-transporting ATPase subunit a
MPLALDVPPISHLVEWPAIWFEGTSFAINKIALIFFLSTACTLVLFAAAARRQAVVPGGLQNGVEAVVEWIQRDIALQVMGPAGLTWMPLLLSTFFFIFFCNITEVIPGLQMPATARMALPAFLAMLIYLLFNVAGAVKQGPLTYVKSVVLQPGLPKPLVPLVAFFLGVSHFIVTPFSLAMRLFANLLAGHLLLVTFAVICSAMWAPSIGLVALPFAAGLLVALTGFEVLVSVLQAFIFTMLTAVYLDEAMHPHH